MKKEDPRLKEVRRLLAEIEKDRILEAKSAGDNQVCECGHKHKEHGLTYSINYSAGMCKKCKCMRFLIK